MEVMSLRIAVCDLRPETIDGMRGMGKCERRASCARNEIGYDCNFESVATCLLLRIVRPSAKKD